MLRTSHRVGIVFALLATLSVAPPAPAGSKIAHFRVAGPMNESPDELAALFEDGKPKSFLELLQLFHKAAQDAEVKAVLLTIEHPAAGPSQIMELCDAVKQLRAAGKEVYCHAEALDLGTYLLAASCSRLSMVPTGDLAILGLHGEVGFYKDLLAKIGVTADMLHIGSYKGAGEPYMQSQPSPEFREQMERLFDDLYDQIVGQIAELRGVTKDKAKGLIDDGPYTAEWALEAGLIDEIAYRKDWVREIESRHPGADIDSTYGRRKAPQFDFSNPFALFTEIGKLFEQARAPSKPAVAVVYVDGLILSGKSEQNPLIGSLAGSTTLRHALEQAAEDPMVKAVVLRVDSPGGSALASEIIWNATQRVAAKKPLIVSMGNVAGSGGYYVSCGGQTIFADPMTLTGSIGVVGGKFVMKGLWDKMGINTYMLTRGKNAAMFTTERPFTESERARVLALMEHVYAIFKDRVTRGRGKNLSDDLEKLAGGRVYTGREALNVGLVDRLGGLQAAIRHAADQAHVGEYEVIVLPKSKSLMDFILEAVTGESEEDKRITTQVGALLDLPGVRPTAEALRALDAPAFENLVRAVQRLLLLRAEPVLAVVPFDLTVR